MSNVYDDIEQLAMDMRGWARERVWRRVLDGSERTAGFFRVGEEGDPVAGHLHRLRRGAGPDEDAAGDPRRRTPAAAAGRRPPGLLAAPLRSRRNRGRGCIHRTPVRHVHVQEVRPSVTGGGEAVHDVRRDVHPGVRPDLELAILEPDRELSLSDEEAVGVPGVKVQRRSTHARFGPDLSDRYRLDVGEKRHAELAVACDPFPLPRLQEDRLHRAGA